VPTERTLWNGISNACIDDVPEQVFYGVPMLPSSSASAKAQKVKGYEAKQAGMNSLNVMLPSHELVRQARARATSQETDDAPMEGVSWTGISGACIDQANLQMVYETPRRASQGASATEIKDERASSMTHDMPSTEWPSNRAPMGLRTSMVLQPSPSPPQPRLWSGLHNEASSSQDVNCMPSPSPPPRRRPSRTPAANLGEAPATAANGKENATKAVRWRDGAEGLASLTPLSFTLAFH